MPSALKSQRQPGRFTRPAMPTRARVLLDLCGGRYYMWHPCEGIETFVFSSREHPIVIVLRIILVLPGSRGIRRSILGRCVSGDYGKLNATFFRLVVRHHIPPKGSRMHALVEQSQREYYSAAINSALPRQDPACDAR